LSEKEQAGGAGEQPGQQQPVALAARQRLYRRLRALRGEEKIAQVRVDVTRSAVDRDGVVAVADGVEDGAFGIQLLALLVVIGRLDVGAAAHFAVIRR